MSDKMQERDKLIKGILTKKQYKQYQKEIKNQQKNAVDLEGGLDKIDN